MNDTRNAAAVVREHPSTVRSRGHVGERISLPWLSFNRTGAAIFLYGTLAAFLVAFILYPAQHLVASTVDLNGFGALARSIAKGHGFSDGLSPTIRRAPLYPFVGAAFMKVFGSGSLYASSNVAYKPMLAGNCLAFGLTTLTVWAIARRLFTPRVAVIA